MGVHFAEEKGGLKRTELTTMSVAVLDNLRIGKHRGSVSRLCCSGLCTPQGWARANDGVWEPLCSARAGFRRCCLKVLERTLLANALPWVRTTRCSQGSWWRQGGSQAAKLEGKNQVTCGGVCQCVAQTC